MRSRHRVGVFAVWVLCVGAAAEIGAQEAGVEEIVVTGAMTAGALPAVTIRKRADFLLQAVQIANDTREAKARQSETYQTLRGLVQAASRTPGVSLAIQLDFLQPITAQTVEIPLEDDGEREDTSSATIFVKLALTPEMDVSQAITTLQTFIQSARMTGRTSLEPEGEVALSVVNPERYRPEVMAALASTVQELRAAFGERCQIAIGDFSQRLQWQRSDVSELTLYMPYGLTVSGC